MSLREKSDAFHAHLDTCQQCRENPFHLCNIGHHLLIACGAEAKDIPGLRQCKTCGRPEVHCTSLEGAEAPPQQTMDQPGMDQRRGRTVAEIEAERKAIAEAPESAPKHYADLGAAYLFRGAWLALTWVVDDEEYPMALRDRLKSAAEGRG